MRVEIQTSPAGETAQGTPVQVYFRAAWQVGIIPAGAAEGFSPDVVLLDAEGTPLGQVPVERIRFPHGCPPEDELFPCLQYYLKEADKQGIRIHPELQMNQLSLPVVWSQGWAEQGYWQFLIQGDFFPENLPGYLRKAGFGYVENRTLIVLGQDGE